MRWLSTHPLSSVCSGGLEALALTGKIEVNPDGLITGSVQPFAPTSSPITVEINLGAAWHTTVSADPATGKFSIKAPSQAFPTGEPLAVTATITGSATPLTGSGERLPPPLPLELVAGDIVNNCNLRCPFCLTDYALTRGTKQMPADTYAHSLQLLPIAPESAFWLSCMHEPSIHPSFGQFLKLVPIEFRRKISYTTNFAKKLSDELLHDLAETGAHSIRISIDSHNPELFAQLRKGARYDVFIDNLTRYSAIMRATPGAPLLHIITMAFTDNLAELPELVRWCHEVVGARFHEVRYMYYLPHVAKWGADHILPLDEWEQLKRDLFVLPMGDTIAIGEPEANVHTKFRDLPGYDTYESMPAVFGGDVTRETYRRVDPLETGFPVPDEPLRLRLRWDGLLMAEQLPEDEFRINVHDLTDPTYFYRLRAAAALPANSPWSKTTSR
jgi:hypothetical protein